MTKVWFITGSSRGLGRSLTEAVLASGDKVAATARKPEQLQVLKEQYGNNVLLLPLDVNDKAQISNAVEQTVQQFGRIDILVNNAGFGIIGAAEAFTDEQVRSQLKQTCMHLSKLRVRYCPTCAGNARDAFCKSVQLADV